MNELQYVGKALSEHTRYFLHPNIPLLEYEALLSRIRHSRGKLTQAEAYRLQEMKYVQYSDCPHPLERAYFGCLYQED